MDAPYLIDEHLCMIASAFLSTISSIINFFIK